MTLESKIVLPSLKYHNMRGRLVLRDHVVMLKEVFLVLEVAVSPPSAEYKLLFLTYRIYNDISSTVPVSHVFVSSALKGDFRAVSIHTLK